ncbi:NDR1/HIN1-like protein 10 [Carica papaya]|uniref:NDR1/HIN1-like protein 10 n=1 Tax=Carica papaya TaxID=3649 RepID=UPI000B8C74AD|nr:NDR1/HIN1-like protein 10 [Carica papaya]
MSTSAGAEDKTVTGYPAQPGQVASGYPAATAYPYAAPQPPPPQPYVFHQHHHPGPTYYAQSNYNQRRPFMRTFLCRLIVAFIVVICLMGLISFITWLVLRPRLPEFRVDSASVPKLNSTRSELSGTWVVSLLVKNPNSKLSVTYDRLQAYVFYGEEVQLGSTQLPPFSQGKGNESSVQFQLNVMSEYVGEDVVNSINKERNRGLVNFGVNVYALVRFRTGVWRMRQHLMRVYCNPVGIGFSGNNGTGTLVAQSRQCEVDL